MKKLLAVALCLALVGCGGEDDIQPVRDAFKDTSGAPTAPANPSTPSNPSTKSAWEYSETGSSRFAKIRSSNTIPTSNANNDAIMLVTIQNFVDTSGMAKDYLNITVLFASTDCDVNCDLRFNRGSSSNLYKVRESVDGVFGETSFASGDMEKLLESIQKAGKASIIVPLDDVRKAEFEFDFSGYDSAYMTAER